MPGKLDEISKALDEKQIIIISIPSNDYHHHVLQSLKIISEKFDKSVFVTVNKPYMALSEEFRKNGIDESKFRFIDCITQLVSGPESENCVYVDSPSELTALFREISKAIKDNNSGLMVFDSVATLPAYNKTDLVVRFLHTVIAQLNVEKVKGVFPFPSDGLEEVLSKDLEMFSDEVVEFGESK
ncbi:MAG TPA: hypothetical protein ENN13_01160 [Candidatus Altiarchaeales archaeon]|nr:hypothetical protein [Candidatus Altiarchaeales archaeon]